MSPTAAGVSVTAVVFRLPRALDGPGAQRSVVRAEVLPELVPTWPRVSQGARGTSPRCTYLLESDVYESGQVNRREKQRSERPRPLRNTDAELHPHHPNEPNATPFKAEGRCAPEGNVHSTF